MGFVAVVLAAGSSSRMGFNKLVADLCGRPVVSYALGLASSVERFSRRLVVVGFERDRVVKVVEEACGGLFEVVGNEEHREGIASSIRAAVSHAPGASAYAFIHGDMPFVRRETLEALLDHFIEGSPLIAVPRYKGVRGLPVIVSGELAGELKKLRGDVGARTLFSKYSRRVLFVDVEDEYVVFDIDTPEDLEKARAICSDIARR